MPSKDFSVRTSPHSSPGIDLDNTNVSYASGISPHRMIDMKSPLPARPEDGALRAGEALHICSVQCLGLFMQYAAVGLMYGTLPQSIYPFLTYYLNAEGIVSAAAAALLDIPWSFKIFFGILSDNFPIFGFRRRPYMLIGWSICSSALFIAGSLPMPDPYFPNPEWRDIKPNDYTAEIRSSLNESAQNAGAPYILLMTLATMGFLMADCAADGVIVEYAQREPIAIRGRIQTVVYMVRTMFMCLAQLLLAFGLNSPQYGGTFNHGLSFSTIMVILAASCLAVIPITWLCIFEEKYTACTFKEYLRQLWNMIQGRVYYQLIAYSFFTGVFSGVSYVAYGPVTSYWIKASSFSISMSTMAGYAFFVLGLFITGAFGLDWNWRYMIAMTLISMILLDTFCTMMATFDIIREPWLWLGSTVVENIPSGIMFIVQSYAVVELADDKNEGTLYGIITTSQNVGSPFAASITKNINSLFAVWNDDIMNDTPRTRRDVAITFGISCMSSLFSLVFLVWLPSQKKETHILKAKSVRNKWMGMLTIGYVSFALIWSILSNILSIFASTQCLSLTGGCKD
uniref:FolateBiopterin Transporter (FBT) Family putative n=1 Tax=Albugo laibachii Nc14 TaxID=890382 RepID=F0WEC2_9STRA|nr:FolateBiopterin Transporter (FBT) Family putative [Albugo laibachii Nc14]|eukprot:CCA19553.1 FolateBiopterin Transporter (FBT) Family putative [Albugo laibachii Nc14]